MLRNAEYVASLFSGDESGETIATLTTVSNAAKVSAALTREDEPDASARASVSSGGAADGITGSSAEGVVRDATDASVCGVADESVDDLGIRITGANQR